MKPLRELNLGLRNRHKLARNACLSRRRTERGLHCTRDRSVVRQKEPNLVRYNFDDGDAWVFGSSVVYSVFEITEVARDTVQVLVNTYYEFKNRTHIGFQCFFTNSGLELTFAVPAKDAQFVDDMS
jgi:uncharacterized protein YqjF (DUF2071 family)